MNKISGNHAIFNRVFFGFSFKLIGSKISIYVSIFIYCLIITAYTIIVPSVANKAPIELFSLSTSSMFLMFAISVVSCYVAIEIFRTGIDDGTELLTISKPISRKEIITVKLIIFLIYMFVIALISLIISSFVYLNELSLANDSLNIMLGIFVGTIVSGIIFGSIATILSIYVKKISAMLITVAISFILMLISMLMSFIITTPVQYISDSGKSLVSVNAVNYNKNNKKVNFNQGVAAIESSSGKYYNPEDVWKDALNRSGYNRAISFDFGYQISSVFTLNSVNTDLQKVLKTLTALNQPVDLNFSSYDLNNISNIECNYSLNNVSFNENLYLSSNGSSSLTNIGSDVQNSFNGRVKYSNDDIEKMNKEVIGGIDESGSQVKYWDDAWTNYKASNAVTTSSTSSEVSSASEFVRNFFAKNPLSANSENTESLIKQINTIQYSSFISLLYKGVQINSKNNNGTSQISNEDTVKLELLGIDLSLSVPRLQNSIIFDYTVSDSTTTKLVLSNPFSFFTKDIMSQAKIVNVEPILQSKVIIPIWVAISIIIFIAAIALYFRRDFA